ncbi:MAG: Fur family transcriptional regulator [Thermaerobacter sp.]|nr:Fur family transcriptional regulator [Thermaerobacter sp.]
MPKAVPEKRFEAVLRQYGLRATPQRAIVIEALTELSHPDAEAVFAYAQRRQPSMSLATVYNVLEKFHAVGLVTLLAFHGRRYFDTRVEHHDHVHCRQCGRLTDVSRDPKTRLVAPNVASWVIEDQKLVWEGLCPACREA